MSNYNVFQYIYELTFGFSTSKKKNSSRELRPLEIAEFYKKKNFFFQINHFFLIIIFILENKKNIL